MKIISFGLLALALISLTACPGKIDPGSNSQTNYGATSKQWGVPLVRVNTAGFNGFPSEPNQTGPSATSDSQKK